MEDDISIYLDVSTYEDLTSKGEVIGLLVRKILNNYFFPNTQSFFIQVVSVKGRFNDYQYSEKNLDAIYSKIKKGELQHLLIFKIEGDDENSSYKPLIALSVTFNYSLDAIRYGYEPKEIANNLAVSINQKIFSEGITLENQNKLIELFQEIFIKINGVNGYISLGEKSSMLIPIESEMETDLNLPFDKQSVNFYEVARGYFWGNILSEKHISKLGGIETIKKEAPCYKIQHLNFNNRQAIYLQITPYINEISEKQLLQLANFFEPVLPVAVDEYDAEEE